MRFEAGTALNLTLRDVLALNSDGSRNDCTLCCKDGAPFDVRLKANGVWARVPLARTRIEGHTMVLESPSPVTAVRYAWTDYVECVLDNAAGLPAGPFTHELPAAAAAETHEGVRPPQALPRAAAPPLESPPMGFNSWNYAHCNIDENLVKALADTFLANGMAAAGYRYVNIDDCWQVERFANGTIQPDPVRFPSGMRALSEYVHSKGLRFGVYTARGTGTCQGRPGARYHELLDAATYCDWAVDYLKIDGCKGTGDANTSWSLFHQGFDLCANQTGRHIVQSVESCDTPSTCGQWVPSVANLWRTGGDIQATWQSMLGNIRRNDIMADVASVGHYNDPDM